MGRKKIIAAFLLAAFKKGAAAAKIRKWATLYLYIVYDRTGFLPNRTEAESLGKSLAEPKPNRTEPSVNKEKIDRGVGYPPWAFCIHL